MGVVGPQDLGRMLGCVHVHRVACAQLDLHAVAGGQRYRDNRRMGVHLRLVTGLALEFKDAYFVILFENGVVISRY